MARSDISKRKDPLDTMIPSLYIDKNGTVRYNLFPEWPDYLEDNPLWNNNLEKKYNEALASAKESSILVSDQEKAVDVIWGETNVFEKKRDSIHPLPKGWRVEIKEEPEILSIPSARIGGLPERIKRIRKVAVLSPIELKEEAVPSERRCKHCGAKEDGDCNQMGDCDYEGEDVPIVAKDLQLKFYPFYEIIDFAVWYSGMSEEKVHKAYARYLKEKPISQGRK